MQKLVYLSEIKYNSFVNTQFIRLKISKNLRIMQICYGPGAFFCPLPTAVSGNSGRKQIICFYLMKIAFFEDNGTDKIM